MNNLINIIKKALHRSLSVLVKDDQEFRNLIFWIRNRRRINISNPETYSDKLNWMMNHFDYRQCSHLADKYEVREYIKKKGYGHYLNQVYGVYSNEMEIDFDNLPMSFVLKPTHGSSMVLFCKDKSYLNLAKVRKTCREWLNTDYSKLEHEIIYTDIPHRILCEKLLQDESGKVPMDFKFFCFHGKPRYISVDFDRFGNHTRSIYDSDWKLTPYFWGCQINSNPYPKPDSYEEMKFFAQDISKAFPFVRVDLYQVDKRIVFGELTFTPSAGTPNMSYECDKVVGSCLDLSMVKI